MSWGFAYRGLWELNDAAMEWLWERSLSRRRLAAAEKMDKEGKSTATADPIVTAIAAFFDVFIFFLLGLIGIGLLNVYVPTLERGFRCGDASIAVAFRRNTIPVRLLLSVCIFAPLFVFVWWERAEEKLRSAPAFLATRRLGAAVAAIMAEYLGGFASMVALMELGKAGFGRLRPHFLAVCAPKAECTLGEWVASADCTGVEKAVRTARQSFPSGHSSAAVYTAVHLLVYLYHLPHGERSSGATRLRAAIVAVCAVLAGFCCLSRVTDGWHFPSDVAAGAALGAAIAVAILLRPKAWARNRP